MENTSRSRQTRASGHAECAENATRFPEHCRAVLTSVAYLLHFDVVAVRGITEQRNDCARDRRVIRRRYHGEHPSEKRARQDPPEFPVRLTRGTSSKNRSQQGWYREQTRAKVESKSRPAVNMCVVARGLTCTACIEGWPCPPRIRHSRVLS